MTQNILTNLSINAPEITLGLGDPVAIAANFDSKFILQPFVLMRVATNQKKCRRCQPLDYGRVLGGSLRRPCIIPVLTGAGQDLAYLPVSASFYHLGGTEKNLFSLHLDDHLRVGQHPSQRFPLLAHQQFLVRPGAIWVCAPPSRERVFDHLQRGQ